MNSQTAQVDDLRLVALPSAVNCTDMFVHFSLIEWSLADMRDDAVDAARQLVEAVVDSTDSRAPGFVTVRLRIAGECLVVEVEDDQVARAHSGAPRLEGRRTGAVPLEGRGKLVWCELPLPTGVTADSVRLPHRGERRRQVPEPAPEQARPPQPQQHGRHQAGPDPDLVDRVLVGLKRREW
ncbi:ATP-binding protein [Prauserella muralis]|uniref:Histidine kinase n=1 Tax=Prauserella muralis TaxID=588067 RepID=A0A2V4APL8_9PSEU|nr:ATP-binding protein [Prauserella muralis]PXY22299.1 histidine kinase [Prauserella muralis]TWE27945.1 hypothetical protein FHX69_0594 [Prauserella muralis]